MNESLLSKDKRSASMPNIKLELTQFNRKIGEAEIERDIKFLRDHLSNKLIFRRAGGQIINRETYLADLISPENTYEYVNSENVEVLEYSEDIALASLRVRAKGKRADTTFEGIYRNTRLFLKHQGIWQCAIWFNTPERI